ncbi:MAPEG family protein [Marinagarivorans cellulosilyticus]|uniref:MAPEG family protein n=1 Tax=Marinagarivorans cellulosilyticus TaxID=2721545 RepID=A0AAN1WKM6_9GAMM|nr:MAPEG family protein [Marinagarivorans cellulosilyticus]BCD99324.1 hypothetical protein MARGE09_P3525 [Marinagarivorans cellulosilyticus]
MITEIQMLAGAGGLLLALTLIQGTRNVILLGLPVAAGNQHDIAPWSGWNDRLNRAIRNLIEAIAIFAPIMLAVHGLGLNNDVSALGAQIFLVSRIVHAVIYTLGVPWIRTLAWFTGIIGIVMVGAPLFT